LYGFGGVGVPAEGDEEDEEEEDAGIRDATKLAISAFRAASALRASSPAEHPWASGLLCLKSGKRGDQSMGADGKFK
jgi:hypothetical protein